MTVQVERFAHVFLRNESGGSKNLNQNGSGTPVIASFTVPAGLTYHVHAFRFVLEDSQTIKWDGFASNGSALANGIHFTHTPNGGSASLFSSITAADETERIKTNSDLASYMGAKLQAHGSYMLIAEWNVAELCGGRGVFANEGDKFTVTINDDLSFLNFFHVSAAGFVFGGVDDPADFEYGIWGSI